jgi:hypothetical protein
MRPALRHPNGPAFDTNALQGFSCSWPVGRWCQAAPYFALRATKGKRGAGSKGAVLGPVSGKNARPRRAHPFPLMSGCRSHWEAPSRETCMPNSPGCLRSVAGRAFSPAGCGFHTRDGHHTDVRSNHNPVVAEDAGKMAVHSRRSFCHDRSVVAPNRIPPDFTKSLRVEPPRSQELGRIPAVRKPAALPLQNRQGSSRFGFSALREIGWDLIDLLRVFRRWVRWSG